MSVQVIVKNRQARGQFNGGEILENKPIGFPREGGELKPYSNLFYWAHAWSDQGSTIGLHPHQGFEIMSFVTEGSIEHYDTAHKEWKRLEKGAAQIIRAGNGISHSEKINAGGHMFQIWFDPNINKTIQQPASYDDYHEEVFPVDEDELGIRTKIYKGEGSPLRMETTGIDIQEKSMPKGDFSIPLSEEKIHSIYIINGSCIVSDNELSIDDFLIVENEEFINITARQEIQLFIVSSLKDLPYKTYAESFGR